MSDGRNKYQSRESRARIRELFMREWDPIGVASIPRAADEYDKYVSEAYVMLMDRNASEDEIAAYLRDVASHHMGLGDSAQLQERASRTAKLLFAMRAEFQTH